MAVLFRLPIVSGNDDVSDYNIKLITYITILADNGASENTFGLFDWSLIIFYGA